MPHSTEHWTSELMGSTHSALLNYIFLNLEKKIDMTYKQLLLSSGHYVARISLRMQSKLGTGSDTQKN